MILIILLLLRYNVFMLMTEKEKVKGNGMVRHNQPSIPTLSLFSFYLGNRGRGVGDVDVGNKLSDKIWQGNHMQVLYRVGIGKDRGRMETV